MLTGLMDEARSAAITPATIFGADLVLWFRSDVGLYTDTAGTTPVSANNDPVACWTDQVSGVQAIQATSGQRPAYQTAGYNGHPCVLFSTAASSGLITASNTFNGLNGGSESSFFAVAQLTTLGNFDRVVSTLDSTGGPFDYSTTTSYIPLLQNSGLAEIESYYVTPGGLSNTAISIGTHYRFGSIRNSTNITTYVNNVAATPAAFPFTWGTAGSYVGIGTAVPSSSGWWDGPIGEIVVTRIAANSTQQAAMDAYFVGKWGT